MTFSPTDLKIIGKSIAQETYRLNLITAKKELSVQEFALLSGRSVHTIYKALSDGGLRYIPGTKKIRKKYLLLF